MLPDATLQVSASLMTLLTSFAPLFTAPPFRTFTMLACGFVAQAGKRTVCGMLTGAGLSRAWSHDRAHRFFSGARWSPDELGLAAAKLVVALLVPAGAPATVAIDDTLFRRRGKKTWAVSWFHDGSVPGPAKTGHGNNWVIAAVVVRLPVISRPVAIPVLAKLVIKGTSSASRLGWPTAWPQPSPARCPAGTSRGGRFRLRRRALVCDPFWMPDTCHCYYPPLPA
jgi:DDE superfamily endonuclease